MSSVSNPKQNDPVLNEAVIQGLKELDAPGQPMVLHKLIEMFLDSVPERITHMKLSLGDDNFEAIRRCAHTLKSSCGNLGASKLYQLASLLEEASQKKQKSETQLYLQQMETEFNHVKIAMLSLL